MANFLEEETNANSLSYSVAFYGLLTHALNTLRAYAVPYFLKITERLVEMLRTLVQQVASAKLGTTRKTGAAKRGDETTNMQEVHRAIKAIVTLVEKAYLYDSKGNISLLCFELISEPLSGLYAAGGLTQGFLEKWVNPCVAQMCESSEDLDKQRDLLNSILLTLRSSTSPSHRLAIAKLIVLLLDKV